MRQPFWTTLTILSAFFVVPQFATAQNLTPQQMSRLLKRFPQVDRDGDGKLSPEEIAPLRERLEKAKKRKEQGVTPTQTKPKGPAPTHADLQYGDHENAVMDVWIADAEKPTPIVVAIHGGGFKSGDKSRFHGCAELQACLENGVSFASINYRFRDEDPRGILACLHDSKRAIQFIRHQAKEWNIDKERVAAFGRSAGAGTTLWLACHDDMADPNSTDPVQRESSRVVAGGLMGTQATYDVLQWKELLPLKQPWTPEIEKRREPDILVAYGVQSLDELNSEKGKAIRKERDMLAWMSADDPPIWMKNTMRGGPIAMNDQNHFNHHPAHVACLKKRADEVGMQTVAIAPSVGLKPNPEMSMIDFLFEHLGLDPSR
ncbi:MAG: carboxylesterase family protein [Planctomycetaceae bacterium]|nr:carboxylesterase family protein [Planctomycetaceae bacterium]